MKKKRMSDKDVAEFVMTLYAYTSLLLNHPEPSDEEFMEQCQEMMRAVMKSGWVTRPTRLGLITAPDLIFKAIINLRPYWEERALEFTKMKLMDYCPTDVQVATVQ